jgi:hypothetical protein
MTESTSESESIELVGLTEEKADRSFRVVVGEQGTICVETVDFFYTIELDPETGAYHIIWDNRDGTHVARSSSNASDKYQVLAYLVTSLAAEDEENDDSDGDEED